MSEFALKRLPIILHFCLLGLFCFAAGRYAYIKIKYPILLENIELKRNALAKSYHLAKSDKEEEKIIDQARKYLDEVLTGKVFPAWYGTPWSFNGNAEQPFQGTVACGAFVENVLKNLGFAIDSRLSLQPSEYIIENMCGKNKILRFSNVSIGSFNDEVREMGEGVYIVGLDRHVGFLYQLDGKYRFVHAHGYLAVIAEIPSLSPTLRMSRYRVVGKLFNDKMIRQWLNGQKILLEHDYFQQKR